MDRVTSISRWATSGWRPTAAVGAAGLIVGLAVGLLIGFAAAQDTLSPPVSRAAQRPATVTVTMPPVTRVVTVTVTPPAPPPPPPGPRQSFGDGLWEVGVDVAAGKYKTDGGGSCYHAVLRSPDGFDIESNKIGSGPRTIVVKAGQYLETSRCGTWTLVP